MASEGEPKRELQVALASSDTAPLGKYFPESGKVRRIEAYIRCAAATATATPIGVIDEVEGFSAELKPCFLRNGKGLEQPEVPVLESRLVDQVAHALRVKRSGSRYGKDRGIEPLAVSTESPDDFWSAADDPVLAVLTATEVGVQTHSGVVRGARHAAG